MGKGMAHDGNNDVSKCGLACFFFEGKWLGLFCQPTNQQYCSLILNQHQPPTTSQSAILFSNNKSAPAIGHNQMNQANNKGVHALIYLSRGRMHGQVS